MQTVQHRRWDPLVRLTHWGVAAGVVANGVFTEEGSGPHQWVGYGVATLLALRWIWGVVGRRRRGSPPSRPASAGRRRMCARSPAETGPRMGRTIPWAP